jgi:hypothetical protein
MFDVNLATENQDAHCIESHFGGGESLALTPLGNEPAHGLHLFCGDRFKRVPITTPGSSLYLCEYKAVAILGNYVDFAGSASPVSVDDLIADSLEKLSGSIFAILSNILF